jgi:hypothetical protein
MQFCDAIKAAGVHFIPGDGGDDGCNFQRHDIGASSYNLDAIAAALC